MSLLRNVTVSLIIVFILVCIVACGTTTLPAATTASTAVPTYTNAPGPSPTSIAITASRMPDNNPTRDPTSVFEELKGGYPSGALLTPENAAAATQAVQQYHELQTRTALTPTEPPPPTIQEPPTPTLGMGQITDSDCMERVYSSGPHFPSCWETQINGQWWLVGGGQVGGNTETPLQSIIIVCPERCYDPTTGTIYETPSNVLEVRIATISGPLVTVVPRDPARPERFFFDLLTRQWVSGPDGAPPPAASPSLAPLPTASVQP